MQIEVLVGNGEPRTYNVDKALLSLGSGDACDIVIDAPSVSRKHATLLYEDGVFFVTDQGSTNGTYLNDQRLVPGLRSEMTSFVSLRLGDDVLITLLNDLDLSDDEIIPLEAPKPQAASRNFDEGTRIISLSSLQTAKTETLVKRRQEIKKKTVKKEEKKEESSKSVLITILAIGILGFAYYKNVHLKKIEQAAEAALAAKVEQERILEEKRLAAIVKPTFIVEEASLTPKDSLVTLINDIKCTSELEGYLCQTLKGANAEGFGVIQVGGMIHVMINSTEWINDAKVMLLDYAGDSTPEDSKKVAALLYIARAIPVDFDFLKIQDLNMTFAFYDFVEGGDIKPALSFAAAVKGSKLQELKTLIQEDHFMNLKRIGMPIFTYSKDYLTIY